jgi:hypothetical protein
MIGYSDSEISKAGAIYHIFTIKEAVIQGSLFNWFNYAVIF